MSTCIKVHINVLILSECRPGFFGINCLQTCTENFYGNLCESKCNCTETQICHDVCGCIRNSSLTNCSLSTENETSPYVSEPDQGINYC